ncbi:unnamed protein product [Vitrella brassicaformis CCMP3155]|uniref:PHD-type domain-containing protein n=1 Tax=Vitrella brassicaformis (strain CCMP3155) TaxID=1169540 RepID=A0A0G4ET12_VITBC|nr:unnamed protein product [Vitrella brassicaformis CCMP3155]|eukprot:CEM00963.1 unnamed protein product [Vitrella brassicaformis CCMP3155]
MSNRSDGQPEPEEPQAMDVDVDPSEAAASGAAAAAPPPCRKSQRVIKKKAPVDDEEDEAPLAKRKKRDNKKEKPKAKSAAQTQSAGGTKKGNNGGAAGGAAAAGGRKGKQVRLGEGEGDEDEEDEEEEQMNDDDYDLCCLVCGQGGNFVCCYACPRVYHLECIGHNRASRERDWLCGWCDGSDYSPSSNKRQHHQQQHKNKASPTQPPPEPAIGLPPPPPPNQASAAAAAAAVSSSSSSCAAANVAMGATATGGEGAAEGEPGDQKQAVAGAGGLADCEMAEGSEEPCVQGGEGSGKRSSKGGAVAREGSEEGSDEMDDADMMVATQKAVTDIKGGSEEGSDEMDDADMMVATQKAVTDIKGGSEEGSDEMDDADMMVATQKAVTDIKGKCLGGGFLSNHFLVHLGSKLEYIDRLLKLCVRMGVHADAADDVFGKDEFGVNRCLRDRLNNLALERILPAVVSSSPSQACLDFHQDGWTTVDEALTEDEVNELHDCVVDSFNTYMREINSRDRHHVLEQGGFDVIKKRGYNRYDLTIPKLKQPQSFPCLHRTATRAPPWLPLVAEILNTGREDGRCGMSQVELKHVGCMLSLPKSADQSIHTDGPHLSEEEHLRAHCVNVFVPLEDITKSIGPTELHPRSQFLWSYWGGQLDGAEDHLAPVTPCLNKGAALLFDYRLKHRGLANKTQRLRPVIYLTYRRKGDNWLDKDNFHRGRFPKLLTQTTAAMKAESEKAADSRHN